VPLVTYLLNVSHCISTNEHFQIQRYYENMF
jgi:hypothetical protein